jgi:cell wall-associated NlpC family hydrolase
MARETSNKARRGDPRNEDGSRLDADILGAERRRRERALWAEGSPVKDDARAEPRAQNRTGSFRTLSLGAAAVGVITASIGIVAPAAHADDYPSWNDVQQAKANVTQQKALVDKINGLIGGLQKNVDAANLTAQKAAEAYLETKVKLDDATTKAAGLKKDAAAAEKTAKASSMRAGLLASHLARSGGDSSINLMLSGGDADHADQLLYQLGTMSQLTEQSSRIYKQAITDKNAASALADQATAAEKTRKKLADDAADALQTAKDAASAAQTALAQQKTKQSELVTQLASLQNVSEQVATEHAAGVAKAAAAAAAKKKAEEQAAASTPSAGGSGSTGSSGGSGAVGGSGSSGGSAPSGGGGSAGAPNSSAVETAIAYAYAHLGAPYDFGGEGPTSYDCSGLTMMAYRAAGIYIGAHSVGDQYYTAQAKGQLVPFSQRQRGDLIFWADGGALYHVAIYLGNNQIIAARDYGEPLAVEGLWGSPVGYVARPSA